VTGATTARTTATIVRTTAETGATIVRTTAEAAFAIG
jgi:hypothetical protein